ncbi:hypothetical protein DFH06DRAFT_1330370 [Mycena polygramma]|nr:hypothetical protein DFH06DRAFT_1330370 [Mycena polygramma]
MFSLNKAFVLVAALFTTVNAQDFVAFSGNSCDGSPGLDVACDGTCFDFTGRHTAGKHHDRGFMAFDWRSVGKCDA